LRYLRIDEKSPYRQLVGVGGVGTGIFFQLEGNHTLGRNESRLGRLLDVRDYCKLHIVIDAMAKLVGPNPAGHGFRIIPVAKVGDDAAGQRVTREMSNGGIDTSHVELDRSAPTLFSACFQYPDGTGGNITTNNSAAGLLSETDIDAIANLMRDGGRHSIALAVPEVPMGIRHYFLELATHSGNFRVASFAGGEVKPARESGILQLLDLVSLNQSEAEELVGCQYSPDSPESFVISCQIFLQSFYPKLNMLITAGKLGAFAVSAETSRFCGALEVKVASTAGAGDSLLGGVLAAIAAGIPLLPKEDVQSPGGDIESALQLGLLLGSYKCTSPHTIHPDISLDRLLEFASAGGQSLSPAILESVCQG
jgi:sugar/nucleoside kinase (ribokinase family)